MTRQEIEKLIVTLPKDVSYLANRRNRFTGAHTNDPLYRRAETRAIALQDPRFGWQYACIFKELKHNRLPCQADLECLQCAWAWMHGEFDEDMDDVVRLDLPPSRISKDILEALLLIPKLSFEQIGEIINVSARAVELYDSLFFNVRDRMRETVYVAGLVYPETRLVENTEDYMQREDAGMIMKRIAYNQDLESLLEFVGVNRTLKEVDSGAAARRVEGLIVNNGLRQIRYGFLNQPNSHGVHQAMRVITAIKSRGAEESNADEVMGLGALSAGQSVLRTVKELQKKDILDRQLLQRLMQKQDQELQKSLTDKKT